jgi:phosphoribosyl 1,2-cyclic phosphodiesterase
VTKENLTAPDTITFLGTGGARFMIISQVLASGGLWFNFGGTEILMDPGPGSIIQATQRKLNPERLSGIIVSHRHLDHSADANIMVEAMTRGGFRRQGCLFAPKDALETEPVVFEYLKKRLESVQTLVAGGTYTLGNVTFTTPVQHVHGVENYGFVFQTGKYKIAYITDTTYFKELQTHYKGDLLLLNVVFLEPVRKHGIEGMPINHLALPDAERLITEIKPKIAILTHFGMGMFDANPSLLAEQITQKTGIRTIAARDGMEFHLSELDMV